MSLDVIVSGRRRQRAVTFNSSTSQPASPLSFHERTPQPVQTFWDMPASGTPATTSLSSIAPPLLGEEALVSARRRQRTSTTDSRTMAPGLSKHQSLQVLDTRRMRRQSTTTAIPTTPTPDALSLSLSSPSVPQQSSSLLSPRTAITPRYSASTPTLPLAQQQLALSQSDPFGSSASLPTALPSASTAALPYASTTSLPSPYTVSPFSTPFTPTNTPTIPFTPTNTPTSMPFSPAPPLTSSTPLAGLNDFTVSPSGLSLSAPPPSVQPVQAPTAALPSTLHFSDSALLDSSSGFSHSAVEVSKSFSSATPFKQADYPPSSPFPVPAQGSSFLPAFNSPTQTTPTTSPFVATTPSSSPFATPSQPSLPFAPPLQQVHSSPSAVPTFAIPTQTSFIAAPTQPAPSFVAPTSTASFAVPASISTPAFAVPTQASFSAVPAQASFMGPNPFASATAPPAFTVPTQASLALPTQSSFALPTQASFASPSLGTPLASASSALLPAPPGPVPNDPLLAQIQQQIQNQTSLLSTMEASLMQQEQQLFELNRQKAMIAQKQATPLDHRTIQFAPHPFS